MNKDERNYAIQRVQEIRVAKQAKIEAKYPRAYSGVSKHELLAAVINKKAKVRPDAVARLEATKSQRFSGNDSVYEVFCTPEMLAAEKQEAKNKEARAKETEALNARTQEILDQLMLGDASAALEMLKQFAAE